MSIFAEEFEKLDSQETAGNPIPDDDYECVMNGVEDNTNPFDGTISTSIEFEVVEGPHARRRIWDNVSHDEKQKWKAAQVWRNMGMPGMPEDWNDFSTRVRENRGKRFTVRTVNRVVEDKTYTNIKRVRLAPPF